MQLLVFPAHETSAPSQHVSVEESVLVDLNVHVSIYMDMHECVFFPIGAYSINVLSALCSNVHTLPTRDVFLMRVSQPWY